MPHRQSQFDRGLLRREARPILREQLTRSQQNGLHFLLTALSEAWHKAQTGVDPAELSSQTFLETKSTDGGFCLMVSGDRGTGKTSLVLTLQEILNGSLSSSDLDLLTPAVPAEGEARITAEEVHEAASRAVWLEPFQMDLIPRPSNLLAALLTRLRDAVERVTPLPHDLDGLPRGALEPRGPVEDAIAELERLMRDVSLAWDGNLAERKSALDPDSYAQEQIRAEHVRIHLGNRFRKVLESLARSIRWQNRPGRAAHPIFVLPIDDIDLNSSNREVLHLIRLVSSPRLVFLMTGNMERLERNLRQDEELSGALRDQIPDILRKLIPPAHRRHLEHMSVEELMSFRPLGSDEETPTLRELLQKIPVRGLPPWGVRKEDWPGPERTLDYLLEQNPISGSQTSPHYSVLSRLQVTPRVAGDLWILFRTGRQGHLAAYQEYQAAVRQDPGLTESQRAVLETAFQRCIVETNKFEIAGDLDQRLRVTRAIEATFPWTTTVAPVEESTCILETLHYRDWVLYPESEAPRRTHSASHHMTAMFLCFHDLVRVDAENQSHNSLVPAPHEMAPAYVVWRDPRARSVVRIPWQLPAFRTFFEWDHFLKSWEVSEVRARANRKLEDSELTKGGTRIANQIDGLVFAMIAASHDLLFGGEVHSTFPWNVSEDRNRERWLKLADSIQKTISGRLLRSGHRENRDSDIYWANQLVLLLSPECAVSSSVVNHFFDGPSEANALKAYAEQPHIAKFVRERRAERAAEFITAGMPHVAQAIIQREDPEKQNAVVHTAAVLLKDLVSWLDRRYFDSESRAPDISADRREKMKKMFGRINQSTGKASADDARLVLNELQLLLSGRLTWDTQLLSEVGTSREALSELIAQLEFSLKGLAIPRGPYNSFQYGILCPSRSEVEQALADLRARQEGLR